MARKNFRQKSHNAEKTEREDPLRLFNAEITEREDPLRLFNIHSVAEHQKIEGGPFGENFRKKVTMPTKSEREDPLVSPGTVCFAEKQKNLFGAVR